MVGNFFFKPLHINDSFTLKCMVYNHFVEFSACCCVMITEFARYNEKSRGGYPVVEEVFAAALQSECPKIFC